MAATHVLCHYRVRPGSDAAFVGLLEKHWPALRAVGLVTDTPARAWSHRADDGRTTYYELFEWLSEAAPRTAHEHPAVMAVWEPMGALCESMEFPHVEPVSLGVVDPGGA